MSKEITSVEEGPSGKQGSKGPFSCLMGHSYGDNQLMSHQGLAMPVVIEWTLSIVPL